MTRETWGNIELPGLSDEELLTKNWNCVAANYEKQANPQLKQKTVEAIHAKQATEQYQKAFADSMKRRAKSNWIDNLREGCKNRNQEWKENSSKARRKKLAKPVITPNGIFATVTEVVNFETAQGVVNANKKVYKWLKDPDSGYRHISQEEYILLTGKDVV